MSSLTVFESNCTVSSELIETSRMVLLKDKKRSYRLINLVKDFSAGKKPRPAGGYSFLNLIIYLIEKYYDRKTAILCSKVFQIERHSQSAFIIFTGQKSHGDQVVIQAQNYIKSNLEEKISMGALSDRFALGRRNFDRRFVKATGNTPAAYMQRVRIEAAKRLLKQTRKLSGKSCTRCATQTKRHSVRCLEISPECPPWNTDAGLTRKRECSQDAVP